MLAAVLLAGCAGAAGGAPEPVDDGPAGDNGNPSAAAPATQVSAESPEGGAAVRLGDTEETIPRLGCTQVNDNWSMSGSVDDGAKIAVMTTADKQEIISVSVVLADGKLVQMDSAKDEGQATISWDDEQFTVVGSGPFLDLSDQNVTGDENIDFVVTGSCPA